MEGDQASFGKAVLAALIVLYIGARLFTWYAKAKYADRQRRYWEQWKREHQN